MESETTVPQRRTAMVTGGATGIGAAVVKRLASESHDVACCFHKSLSAAEGLADQLHREGREIFLTRLDVTSGDQVSAAVRAITEHFGRPIDILVNNAGDLLRTAPVEAMEEDLWDEVMAINLKGIFLCSKYCIPGMKEAGSGRIINISSISARSGGGAGAAHYAASKGAAESFTRALARELASLNVTVNAVAPGVIDTPIHERHNTPESLERLRQNIPLLRIGMPEEVAAVVAFLCSKDASYLTGEVIAVNGGLRMD